MNDEQKPAPERTVHGETSADLELGFVPPEQRDAVGSFEAEAEAELAAGYLRSNGLAAEVGKMMIPGLPFEIALWVRKSDAAAARELLREAEAGDSLLPDTP
ncbi:MAG TPA: hypothetical protein VN515_01350 [Terriglobales bacterium]|nr:hypothetical protein [Terriglobales bacterium]